MSVKDLSFIKALWSPFKPFKLRWYAGKLAIGTPYFYPRRWVEDKEKPGWKKAVPKKIGFNLVTLGWKTKWEATDYRFEWAPLLSFVFFKWQIVCIVQAPEQYHYWEAWLYYENDTDHSLSKQERIDICQKEFPLDFNVYNQGKNEKVNYYHTILRPKYITL